MNEYDRNIVSLLSKLFNRFPKTVFKLHFSHFVNCLVRGTTQRGTPPQFLSPPRSYGISNFKPCFPFSFPFFRSFEPDLSQPVPRTKEASIPSTLPVGGKGGKLIKIPVPTLKFVCSFFFRIRAVSPKLFVAYQNPSYRLRIKILRLCECLVTFNNVLQ